MYETVRELETYDPSFVSVTYGAGGSTRELTHSLVTRIHKQANIPVVPHLTCVGHSRDQVFQILDHYAQAGAKAVLALKGDPPGGAGSVFCDDGFKYAVDLVRFIKEYNETGRHPERDGFVIGVAGFPEGHPSTPNRLKEMDYFKAKVDAGADYVCTQLFFDNHAFFDFRDRCQIAGINIPVIAGIMPIVSLNGMMRMGELAGGTCFPARLQKALARAEGDASAVREVGIQYASTQCAELLDESVHGIHFYTLNQSQATRIIYRNLGLYRGD